VQSKKRIEKGEENKELRIKNKESRRSLLRPLKPERQKRPVGRDLRFASTKNNNKPKSRNALRLNKQTKR
jgi:hypothetical protein